MHRRANGICKVCAYHCVQILSKSKKNCKHCIIVNYLTTEYIKYTALCLLLQNTFQKMAMGVNTC